MSNDVIPIDKAMKESVMNLSKIKLEYTDEVQEDDHIINEETPEENTEEITGNENVNHNDETNESNDSTEKPEKDENIDKIPVRRSERIKKRLIDISPEDIGENDNSKDKDYKR